MGSEADLFSGSLGSCYDIMSPEMLVGGWLWKKKYFACISDHLYDAMNSLGRSDSEMIALERYTFIS